MQTKRKVTRTPSHTLLHPVMEASAAGLRALEFSLGSHGGAPEVCQACDGGAFLF